MAVFTLDITLPDDVDMTTLVNGVRSTLGDEDTGLTAKQAGELAASNFFKGLYFKEIQRVDAAVATAADRAEIDTCRATIAANEASIKATEQGLRNQAEADWA